MDDANLAKLGVNQNGLRPNFNKNITNYEIIVASDVSVLMIETATSDRGASVSIKSNTGFGEEAKLNEGENNIVIEVTSEDGTVKKYQIKCFRLSASDAKLKQIIFASLKMRPQFESGYFEYTAKVDFKITEEKFSLELFDPGCAVEVLCNNTAQSKSDDGSNYLLSLNHGRSEILVKVTSPNKSNVQEYKFVIIRDFLPRLVNFQTAEEKINYEDSITLSSISDTCSISSDGKNKTLMSAKLLEIFQKVANFDLLNIISSSDENLNSPEVDIENKISNLVVKMPLLNGRFSNEKTLKTVSELVDDVNIKDTLKSDELQNAAPVLINQSVENLPTYQVKSWEKHLQIVYDETDPSKLLSNSESSFEKYISILNSTNPLKIKKMNMENDDSPIYWLNLSIFNLASALKYKSQDFKNHVRLAVLLEEKEFYESIYQNEKKESESVETLSSQNKLASDSSKEEEINAICKQRSCGANASDAEKLKALDEEYHYLIDTHQSHKAEQVQLLYHFKAKTVSNASRFTFKLNAENNFLVQSNLKYLDAISLLMQAKIENFTMHFQMGRSCCLIGDFQQALVYLEKCLNWSDLKMQTLSRFYFAYSMSKNYKLLENNAKLVVCYLAAGLQQFLTNISITRFNAELARADDFFSILNTVYLDAFLTLAKIKSKHNVQVELISAEDSLKFCAYLCSLAILQIDAIASIDTNLAKNSKLFKEILGILVDAHSELVRIDEPADVVDVEQRRTLRAKRCIGLVNLLRCMSDKDNEEILRLQEMVNTRLVYADPLEPYHVLLLASAKLELHDFLKENADDALFADLLDESKSCLLACAELQNDEKLSQVSDLITGSKWWTSLKEEAITKIAKKKSIEAAKLKAEAEAKVNNSKTKGSDVKQVAAKGNVKCAAKQEPTPKKALPAVQAKNAKPTPGQKLPPTKPEIKSKTAAEVQNVVEDEQTTPDVPIESYVRKKSKYDANMIFVQSQLYSARIYLRLKEFDKAKSFYDKVIEKEPSKHDAYIELADMHRKNGDLMAAIDVYARFPVKNFNQETFKENSKQNWKLVSTQRPKSAKKNKLSFDDAFIYGELVTTLINSQKYDDPRLAMYLILWAQVMGIGIIEKYITILDKANKTKVCKEVYAGVHNKSLNDPELAQFFKFKGWF